MTGNVPLESEVRRLRREGVPPALRDRVLAAAEVAARSTAGVAPISSRTSWRFAAVVASLAMAVIAGLWYVTASRPPAAEGEGRVALPAAAAGARPGPASPQAVPVAGARRGSSRPVRPPDDDTVVFWVDDDTPVFVNLLEAK